MKSFPLSQSLLLMLAIPFTLTGCFHDKDATPADVATSKQAAKTHITKNLKSANKAFESQVSNASSTQVVVNTGLFNFDLGSDFDGLDSLFESDSNSAPFKSFKSLVKRRKSLNSRENHSPSSSTDVDLIDNAIAEFFDNMLTNPSVDGSTITYHFNTDVICETDQNCVAVLSDAQVIQQVIDDDSGTLTLQYKTFQPLILGYSATSVSLEISLSDTKSTVLAIEEITNESDLASFPDTFTGSIKAALSSPNINTGSLTLSIPQAINIAGDIDGETIDFSMQATDKVVTVTADDNAETAQIEFGLAAITAMFSMDNDDSTTRSAKLTLEKLSGIIDFNGSTETITIQEVTIGSEPLKLTIDDTDALSLSMLPINATIDGSDATITVSSDFEIVYDVTNVFGLFADQFDDNAAIDATGKVTASLPTDSILTVINPDTANEVTQISAGGPLSIIGEDYFAGEFIAEEGDCIQENSNAIFELEVVTCP